MITIGTWELTELPKNSTIVQCGWVLRRKYDSENKVRYYARLVAKIFSRTETFSPVVRHTNLRLLFSLSVQLDLDINDLVVKIAFLNGNLEETLYIEKPSCYDYANSSLKVLKFKKAIYGSRVDMCLLENDHVKPKLEPCMYKKLLRKGTLKLLYNLCR